MGRRRCPKASKKKESSPSIFSDASLARSVSGAQRLACELVMWSCMLRSVEDSDYQHLIEFTRSLGNEEAHLIVCAVFADFQLLQKLQKALAQGASTVRQGGAKNPDEHLSECSAARSLHFIQWMLKPEQHREMAKLLFTQAGFMDDMLCFLKGLSSIMTNAQFVVSDLLMTMTNAIGKHSAFVQALLDFDVFDFLAGLIAQPGHSDVAETSLARTIHVVLSIVCLDDELHAKAAAHRSLTQAILHAIEIGSINESETGATTLAIMLMHVICSAQDGLELLLEKCSSTIHLQKKLDLLIAWCESHADEDSSSAARNVRLAMTSKQLLPMNKTGSQDSHLATIPPQCVKCGSSQSCLESCQLCGLVAYCSVCAYHAELHNDLCPQMSRVAKKLRRNQLQHNDDRPVYISYDAGLRMSGFRAGCAFCGALECTNGGPLKKCSGCKSESYCSREHQKLAWAQHKNVCASLRKHAKPRDECGAVLGACVQHPGDHDRESLVNVDVMWNRAEELYKKNKLMEALAQFKVMARETARTPGVPNHARAMMGHTAHHGIAKCLLALDQYAESESEFKSSFRFLQEAASDPDSFLSPEGHKSQLAGLTTDHARLLSARYEDVDALAAFDDAQKLFDELIPALRDKDKQAWENLQIGNAYLARHRAHHYEVRHEWAAALKSYQRAHALYIAEYPSEHEMIALVSLEMGRVLLDSAMSSMCTRITNGTRVRIGGLLTAAHLNGCIGRVLGLHCGRYIIAADSELNEKKIKAVNVVSLSSDPGESDVVPCDRLVESLRCIRAGIDILNAAHPTNDVRTEALNLEVKALMLIGHPEEAVKRCQAAVKDLAGSSMSSCEHFLSLQKIRTRLEGCPSTQAIGMLPGVSSSTKTNGYLNRCCEGADGSVVLDAAGRRLQLFWPV